MSEPSVEPRQSGPSAQGNAQHQATQATDTPHAEVGGSKASPFATNGPLPPVSNNAGGGPQDGPSPSERAYGDSAEEHIPSPHQLNGPAHLRVTADGLNVRSSPNATSRENIIGGVYRGAQLDGLASEGVWIRISYRGSIAYVHGAYVEVIPVRAPAPIVTHPEKVAERNNDASTAYSKTEAPKTEAPKTEAPKTEAPKTEAPKPEAPKTEAPKTEAPKAEAPKPEAPKPEAPKPEAPKPEAPKPEAPQAASAAPSTPHEDPDGLTRAEYQLILDQTDEGKITIDQAVQQLISIDRLSHGGQMSTTGMELLATLPGVVVQRRQAHLAKATGASVASTVTHPPGHETATAAAQPAPQASTEHAAPAPHSTAIRPVEPVGDQSIASLAAELPNPTVQKVVADLTTLAKNHAQGKRITQGEYVAADRERLVEDIRVIRSDLAGIDKTGLDPKKLGQFVTLVDRQLQELAPYQFQGLNILTIETPISKDPDSFYSTCNMTALAMSLELLGRTAADYNGDREKLKVAAETFHGQLLASWRGAVLHSKDLKDLSGDWFGALAGLRLPDFLELAAVVEDMTEATPEAAKVAQAAAKHDKINPGTLGKLSKRFGVSMSHMGIQWGSELADAKVDDDLGGSFSSQRLQIEKMEHLRAVAERTGQDKDKKAYETARAKLEPTLHGKLDRKHDADTALPVEKYKRAVISQLKPVLDSGAAVMIGAHSHWIRLYGVEEDHVLVQDPGSWYRHEQVVPWEEARAMGYFWTNLVFR